MNVLIIDDNAKTSAALQSLLQGMPVIHTIHKAVQPYLVGSLLASEKVDVIFIRIRLWNYAQFENLNQRPIIIFLSGGKDKLTNKPETTVRYSVREPYNIMDLSLVLRKVMEEGFTEPASFLFLRYDGRFHKTQFSDILMIERMQGSYVQFYLNYGTPLMPGTLPGWIEKLPKDEFIRISDTLILPAQEVKKISGDQYEFKGRKIQLTFRFASGARNEIDIIY